MGKEVARRRKVLVDRKFQLGMSLHIVGWVYAYLVLFALVANFDAFKELLTGDAGTESYVNAVGRLQVFLQVFVLPLVFTFVCMCLHGILFTHRLAGPLYRLKEALRRVRGGDLAADVKLREQDYFQDLCEEINALLGHLRGDLRRFRVASQQLAEEGESLAKSGSLPKDAQERLLAVANASSRLRQLVDGYRLAPEESEPAGAAAPAAAPA